MEEVTKEWLTANEAAEVLTGLVKRRVSGRYVRESIRGRGLAGKRVAGVWMTSMAAIEEWLSCKLPE